MLVNHELETYLKNVAGGTHLVNRLLGADLGK